MPEYIKNEYIPKNCIVLHCEGLAKIAPNDFVGIAKYFADQIIAIPAADVAPVRHGRWINKQGGFWEIATCDQCGGRYPTVGITPNFCPNCGAKMDGGGGDA